MSKRKTQKWSLDITEYAKKTKDKVVNVKKKVAFQLYDSIVKKTPVKTGRARGNWQVDVNGVKNQSLVRYDNQSLGSPSAYNNEVKSKLKEVTGDEKIYIYNNLDYIGKLESGRWSKQAPQGMVALSIMEMNNYVNNAIKSSETIEDWKL